MAITGKCPRCGSNHVQLSIEKSRHGCLWTLLLGWIYILWVLIRWLVGIVLFFLWDWWTAILHAFMGKGHVWQCRKWFSGYKRVFYCHDCGCNFRA